MNIRQAKKIIREGTLDGRHNDYWCGRWIAFLLDCRFVDRETAGDHRIRKAVVVYERRKRKNLRK